MQFGFCCLLTLSQCGSLVPQGKILAVKKAQLSVALLFKGEQFALGLGLLVIVGIGIGGKAVLLPDKVEFPLLVFDIAIVFLLDKFLGFFVGFGITALGLEAQFRYLVVHFLFLDAPLAAVAVQLLFLDSNLRIGLGKLMGVVQPVLCLAGEVVHTGRCPENVIAHLAKIGFGSVEVTCNGVPDSFAKIGDNSGGTLQTVDKLGFYMLP